MSDELIEELQALKLELKEGCSKLSEAVTKVDELISEQKKGSAGRPIDGDLQPLDGPTPAFDLLLEGQAASQPKPL